MVLVVQVRFSVIINTVIVQNTEYELLPSGRRYRVPLLRTARAQISLISSGIAPLK